MADSAEKEKLIEHLCKLSAIRLSSEEKQKLASELERIIGYVQRIQSINTEGVNPTRGGIETPLELREDKPKEPLNREDVITTAPDTFCDLFRTPPILEE
jgi:aspartyl-tRNA(Asn)/glutamyl-tRNA(Gln) amidotransferase subunit C